MTTLTRQSLQAQIISDPAQAAALRELLGGDSIEAGNVAIVMLDGDTLEGSRATVTFDNAPGAAYVPTSDSDARGIEASRRDGTITTTDGYTFRFDENELRIDVPGRDGGRAETLFRGNMVTEADGTEWEATDGNYVLPNGAMFTLDFEEDGTLKNFTLVHGDSRVDVGNLGDDPHVGRVRDGGYAYRMDAVEQNFEGATFHMGGYNDAAGEGDVAWAASHLGQYLGVMGEDGADPFGAFVVDESLRPEFGTHDYERMLRSEIEDIRSVISGGIQSAGGSDAYGDMVADYLLGSSGAYQQYAQAAQQSVNARQSPQDAQMQQLQQYFEQMFGGMPQTQSWDQGMQALAYLMQMYAQSQGMQTDYAAATNNLRGYIPSAPAQANPSAMDAAALVDQIISGVGQQQRNGGNRNRLEAFDLANGGFQGPSASRRGADDSVARLLQHRVARSGRDIDEAVGRRDIGRAPVEDREMEIAVDATIGEEQMSATARENLVNRLREKLEYGIADWAITDEEAHDVIRELSHHSPADLQAIARELGPESISRLHDNLTDEDKAAYASTLEALGVVTNIPTGERRETSELVAEMRDKLEYGVVDWAVTEDEARDALDFLSQIPTDQVAEVIDELGPDLTSRIVDNLSDADRERYGPTIDRLNLARNFRREETASTRELVEDLESDLSRGILDWNISEADARGVLDRMSRLPSDQLAEVAEHLGPDMLYRLEDNLSDSDRETYGPTLDRLRTLVNNRGAPLTDFSGAKDRIEDALTYGIGDWVVTDSNARAAISELARYDEAGFRRLVDSIDHDYLARIRDNLTDEDARTYAVTLQRLSAYAGL